MGYCTTVVMDLKVQTKKVRKFRKLIARMKAKCSMTDWFGYYGDIQVADDGAISFEYEDRKWYSEQDFYDFIKNYVTKGTITGAGEDVDDRWQVEFDGDGHWEILKMVFLTNREMDMLNTMKGGD